jgi:tripartite-type tricarboxylate transporter receptor subunit TctC
MTEAGMDGFEVTSWHLWAAPAGTPRPIIDRLVGTIRDLYADPSLQQRALDMGARLLGSTPEEVAARLARERPVWAEMVRVSGAKAE